MVYCQTESTWEKRREKYFVWIFLYDIKSYQCDQHTSKTHSGWYKSWNNVSWVEHTNTIKIYVFWTSFENNTRSWVWIGAAIRWTISNQWYITSMGRHSSVNYFDSLNLLKRYSEESMMILSVEKSRGIFIMLRFSFRNLSKYFSTNFNFLLSLATEYILFLNRLNYTFPL